MRRSNTSGKLPLSGRISPMPTTHWVTRWYLQVNRPKVGLYIQKGDMLRTIGDGLAYRRGRLLKSGHRNETWDCLSPLNSAAAEVIACKLFSPKQLVRPANTEPWETVFQKQNLSHDYAQAR